MDDLNYIKHHNPDQNDFFKECNESGPSQLNANGGEWKEHAVDVGKKKQLSLSGASVPVIQGMMMAGVKRPDSPLPTPSLGYHR